MTCELIRLQKFYTVDLSLPRVWVLKSDFIFQGNQGWVTKWRLFSQLLLILVWLLKACRYSNMWTAVIILACYFVIQLFSFLYFLFLVKVVSKCISLLKLRFMLPIPRMPQQYQKLLVKSFVKQRADLLTNSSSPQMWKRSVSTS